MFEDKHQVSRLEKRPLQVQLLSSGEILNQSAQEMKHFYNANNALNTEVAVWEERISKIKDVTGDELKNPAEVYGFGTADPKGAERYYYKLRDAYNSYVTKNSAILGSAFAPIDDDDLNELIKKKKKQIYADSQDAQLVSTSFKDKAAGFGGMFLGGVQDPLNAIFGFLGFGAKNIIQLVRNEVIAGLVLETISEPARMQARETAELPPLTLQETLVNIGLGGAMQGLFAGGVALGGKGITAAPKFTKKTFELSKELTQKPFYETTIGKKVKNVPWKKTPVEYREAEKYVEFKRSNPIKGKTANEALEAEEFHTRNYTRGVKDEWDPNIIFDEIDDKFSPAPSAEFSLGNFKKQRYSDYSDVSPAMMRYIDSVVEEVVQSQPGQRVFIEVDGQGSTPVVKAAKSSAPDWFKEMNAEIKKLQKQRAAIKKKNAKLPKDKQKPLPDAPAIVKKADLVKVANKIAAKQPLGKREGEIAQTLFDVAKSTREENVNQMLKARESRYDPAEVEGRIEEAVIDSEKLPKSKLGDDEVFVFDEATGMVKRVKVEELKNELKQEADANTELADCIEEIVF